MNIYQEDKGEIFISPISLGDSRALFEQINDKDISDSMRNIFPSPCMIEDIISFINWASLEREAGTGYHLAIRLKESNIPIGMIGIGKIDFERRNAELGYWIGENYRRRGYATEAIKYALDFCFKKIDIDIVYADVQNTNNPSLKLLDKIGFCRIEFNGGQNYQSTRFWIDKKRYNNTL